MAHQLGPYRFRALAEQMADQRLLNQLSRARRGPDTPAGPVVQQPEPAITITLDTPDIHRGRKNEDSPLTEEQIAKEATRAIQEHTDNRKKNGPESNVVTLVGPIFEDPGLDSRNAEDQKRIAEVYLYRYGELTNNFIDQIIKGQPGLNDSNRQSFEKSSRTLFYFEHTTRHLRSIVGEEKWDEAPDTEKKKILVRLFRQASAMICRAAFPIESNTIDFDMIFRGEDNDRLKWQKFTRDKFVNLAMTAWRYRINSNQPKATFEMWKSQSVQLAKGYNLGSVSNVPTKKLGALGWAEGGQ